MLVVDILWVGLFLGFVLGWVAHFLLSGVPKSDGCIIANNNDLENKGICNISIDPEKLKKKKRICLRVFIGT